MADAWIALSTGSREVGWASKLSGGAFAAWAKFLMTVKDRGGRGGVILVKYLDTDWLAKNNVTLEEWSSMLAAAIADKAVVQKDGRFIVKHWDSYQRDPTNAERQQRFREGQSNVTDDDVTLRNGSNGDRTGQDRTRQDNKKAAQEVFNAWNSLGPPFSRIVKITPKRLRCCQNRLADDWWRENWRKALGIVKASPFCRGENERGWTADIEFFLRPDSVAKAIEGKYKAKPQHQDDDPMEGMKPHRAGDPE